MVVVKRDPRALKDDAVVGGDALLPERAVARDVVFEVTFGAHAGVDDFSDIALRLGLTEVITSNKSASPAFSPKSDAHAHEWR